MRLGLLRFAAIVLIFHLVGCDGGGAAPATDSKPTPEQQKEIEQMKADMAKQMKKGR